MLCIYFILSVLICFGLCLPSMYLVELKESSQKDNAVSNDYDINDNGLKNISNGKLPKKPPTPPTTTIKPAWKEISFSGLKNISNGKLPKKTPTPTTTTIKPSWEEIKTTIRTTTPITRASTTTGTIRQSPCDRTCMAGSSLTCHYKFVVEWQTVLGKSCFHCPLNMADCNRPHCVAGDGVERGILTVNRSLPGPDIVVCVGDRVVVDVENNLPATTTTIHWHGQYVRDEPWNDGVPHVTQCPILPLTTFRYNFTARPAGTHWWHSHAALQREDGLYGKYIVREPDVNNVHKGLYDEDRTEHVIIIQDWVHKTGVDMFLPHHMDDGSNKPQSFLVNGKGRFKNFGVDSKPGLFTPVEVFDVEPGRRYRFRVISAGVSMCPVEMTVDDHNLTVIASDGRDVKPVTVDVLMIHNAERYDVIIDTGEKAARTYLIRFGGRMDCGANGVHGVALLKYKGAPVAEEVFNGKTEYKDFIKKPGTQLNAMNRGQGNAHLMSVADLRNAKSFGVLNDTADRTLFIGFSFYNLTNPNFYHHQYYTFQDVVSKLKTPQFNNITNKLPSSPLLSQANNINKDMICNEENLDKDKHCNKQGFCECHHIIELVLDEVVDIFLIDEGLPWDVTHPFHLHGHNFQVLAMERLGNDTEHLFGASAPGNDITKQVVMDREAAGKIPRNLDFPPLKDTVVVPDAGYTLIRLTADNPGFWLFHCHMSWHAEVGMSLIFKVGNQQQIPQPPRMFPTCGDFI